jgi:hypothetical protein
MNYPDSFTITKVEENQVKLDLEICHLLVLIDDNLYLAKTYLHLKQESEGVE